MNIRLIIGAVLLTNSLVLAAAEPRVRYTINEQWRYAPGPIESAERPDFDDRAWEAVNLPHTWNAQDAFDEPRGYRRGIGWYRKRLNLPAAFQSKRLFLYFEGANQVADVYLNGRHAGQHVGGYTAFVFEITELVHWDRSNVVAVRVDNRHSQDIPPLNADFTFYGGIYRDVWLVATEPVHVTVTDHASPGVFIDTPKVSNESASVRITGTVVNQSDRDARVRVTNRILDAAGNEVTSTNSALRLAARGSARFHQLGALTRPRLWSPQQPYLYFVRTRVYEGARLVDVVDNPLGLRWFRFDGSNGFWLNGKRLRLNGTNRHQDFAGLGNALPNEFHWRDVRLIKETGFNFLRLAHYPQDPALLEATDRTGLIVWEEIPIVNLISTTPEFAAHSERMLTEMIRQHYNHPSILFWGYMNEVLLTKPNPVPEGYYDVVPQLARRLEARVHVEDPGRATVMALSRDEIADHRGLAEITDILGFNLYFGWYYQKLENLGSFLDEFHRAHPDRPLMVSEYGADSDERVHTMTPVPFDFSDEYAQIFHRASFPQIESRSYLLGSAVWNNFDFGSESRDDTKHALNQKGLFYFDRIPKDTAHYYRAALLDEPVLHVAREWSERAGSRPEDRTQPLWVYTNLQEVELLVNGRSEGTRKVENRTAEWSVELANGANVIRARGRSGERWLEDSIRIGYADRANGEIVAVNAGGAYSYLDAAGVIWEADWGFVGGTPAQTHHRIFSTPDDPLYQASREGMQAYRFDIPDGRYEVTLGFAEWKREIGADQRVFSVKANDAVIVADLDLAGDYGAFTAVSRTAVITATAGQGITIEFIPKTGQPTVSAILVRRLWSAAAIPPPSIDW